MVSLGTEATLEWVIITMRVTRAVSLLMLLKRLFVTEGFQTSVTLVGDLVTTDVFLLEISLVKLLITDITAEA